MLIRETASWHDMTFQYGLTDAWKLDNFFKMSKKKYTFDNNRSGARSTISRINKFLIFQDLDARVGQIEATMSINKLSYHSLLVLTIWGQSTNSLKQNKYFDPSLLGEGKCKATMFEVWERELPKPTKDTRWAP